MIAGPATPTESPVARNSPVPIAPPSAIMVCWADDSWRDSTCSLRTDAGCSVGAMGCRRDGARSLTPELTPDTVG